MSPTAPVQAGEMRQEHAVDASVVNWNGAYVNWIRSFLRHTFGRH